MSVVIKSNNVSSSYFGTSKIIGTTAQAEFNKYKTRVVGDGGVIKDEARTLKAFDLLFNSKMYGNMNCAVSGTFGVKTNVSGGITKLYSIDGYDLIGAVYGTGVLPILDASNNISFASNDPSQNINGGLLTTESKLITSKIGNFGYALSVKSFGGGAAATRLLGLTKHSDVTNWSQISNLVIQPENGQVQLNMHADPLDLINSNSVSNVNINVDSFGYPMISFLTLPESSKLYGSRNGTEMTVVDGKTFTEITREDFYIDFGGTFQSNLKYFSKATVRDFFCFNQATREQSSLLSSFA